VAKPCAELLSPPPLLLLLLLLLPVVHRQDSEITHVSDTIDLSTMPVEDGYTGPRMQGERRLVRPVVC
jgi:hypothetical protein